MTAITDTRKRSRDEDSCDFMPISKRINNLSINNPYISDNNIALIQQPEPNHDHGYGNPLHQQQHQIHHNYQPHLQNGHHQALTNVNGIAHLQHQHHSNTNGNAIGDDNYFHMNNNYMGLSRPSVNNHSLSNGIVNGNGNGQLHPHHHHYQQQRSAAPSTQSNDEFMSLECYNPELTQDENPFYYNKNKLLFDLHIERQRRQPPT